MFLITVVKEVELTTVPGQGYSLQPHCPETAVMTPRLKLGRYTEEGVEEYGALMYPLPVPRHPVLFGEKCATNHP